MQNNSTARAKRIDLSFPLCFVTDDGVENDGHCLNISESGMMASFGVELDLWTVGTLRLSFAHQSLALQARVARCDGHDAGLAFLFSSDEQHGAILALVSAASAQSRLAGGVAPF